MLYVQQSLAPNEEILMAARFHWMYTFQAIMWIVIGLAGGITLACFGVWWEISAEVRAYYPNLPAELFPQAFDEVVENRGGYLKILWGLNPLFRFGILGAFLVGLFLFAHMMIVKATTEIAITTERLVYKRGLIARHVGELSCDRIEGVTVRQGILARLLGYGRVSIRGMGVGEVILPPIDAPIEFRKAVQEAQILQDKGGRSGPVGDF